jgi:hypothetical protein
MSAEALFKILHRRLYLRLWLECYNIYKNASIEMPPADFCCMFFIHFFFFICVTQGRHCL